jgi:hypothetical protein
MPLMAEAVTEKEAIDEKAEFESLSSFRASGPTGAALPLPLSGAPQLLIGSSPISPPAPVYRPQKFIGMPPASRSS